MELSARYNKENGFTLIELLVVLGILAIISAMTIPYYTISQQKDLDSWGRQIVVNTEEARDKSMAFSDNFGIYFEENSFTIFKGESYDSSREKYKIDLADSISISSINLPGSQLVFKKISGEVMNYQPDSNGLTISSDQGESMTISINKLGVVSY